MIKKILSSSSEIISFLIIFFFLLFFSPIKSLVYAATTYDMANTANFNIRFDGPATGDYGETKGGIGLGGATLADVDGDGKPDVIVGDPHTDYNGRNNSGSVYVIYNSLFNSLTQSGNRIDLSDPSNYNLRFDGAVAGDRLSYLQKIGTGDFDGDGKIDILIGTYEADNNSRTDSGSVYVIYNTLIDNYSGTGNTIDLADSSNYNLRFDGAASGDLLAGEHSPLMTGDIDNNGKSDFIVGANWADNNFRDYSGSIYINLYNLR